MWFLIRKNRIDLRDIPVAKLTEQYLEYVATMKALDLDLAAEYLAMAATLIALKARLLLPRAAEGAAGEEAPEEDPRARLVAQLLRYEQYRQVAETLDRLPRAGRDFTWTHPVEVAEPIAPPLPVPTLQALARAWWGLLARQDERRPHEVVEEPLTVTVVSQALVETLRLARRPLTFSELLPPSAERRYLVTAFFALLELTRLGAVDLTQDEPLAPIVVALTESADEALARLALEKGNG
nr:ScpA family protein [Hydrogenophilus thiooxidans]